MAYMTRLGLWGPETHFPTFERPYLKIITRIRTRIRTRIPSPTHVLILSYPLAARFREEIEEGGLGARESIALHLKATGAYLARLISFQGRYGESKPNPNSNPNSKPKPDLMSSGHAT